MLCRSLIIYSFLSFFCVLKSLKHVKILKAVKFLKLDRTVDRQYVTNERNLG